MKPFTSRIDCLALPAEIWANGSGTTRTLARAADADGAPLWRISLATLQGPSNFSLFPGLDRTFVQIDQPAVDLHLPEHTLHARQGQPVHFSGDIPVRLDMPADTLAQALNIMTRRGRCRAQVDVFARGEYGERGEYGAHTENGTKIQLAATHFLVSLTGAWRVAGTGVGEVELGPLQGMRVEGYADTVKLTSADATPDARLASVAIGILSSAGHDRSILDG